MSVEPELRDAGFTCAYRMASWGHTLPLARENNRRSSSSGRSATAPTPSRRSVETRRGAFWIRSEIRCRRSKRICPRETAAGCANTWKKCARSSGASSRWMRRSHAIWICRMHPLVSRPTSKRT